MWRTAGAGCIRGTPNPHRASRDLWVLRLDICGQAWRFTGWYYCSAYRVGGNGLSSLSGTVSPSSSCGAPTPSISW